MALLAAPASALAHANLARSEPAGNASLAAAPAQVQLWFTEKPDAKLSTISVFNQQRSRVDQGPVAAADGDATSLTKQLPANLPTGTYVVSWQTTSAIDGHVTGGAFAFGVGVAPTPADVLPQQVAVSNQTAPISIVIRLFAYLSLVGLFGLAVFPSLIVVPALIAAGAPTNLRDAARSILMRCRRFTQGIATLGVLASAAVLADQTWRSTGTVTLDGLVATSSSTVGVLLVARLAVAVLVLLVGLSSLSKGYVGRPDEHRSLGAAAAQSLRIGYNVAAAKQALLPLLVLFELLLTTLSGHAAAVPQAPELAIFVGWLHLALAGVWFGGLAGLSLVVIPLNGGWTHPTAKTEAADTTRNQVFGPVLQQFSRLALVSAIGLGLTGLYQALIHVGTIDNLLSTDYGHSLVVKTLIFLAALLLAGFHRFMLKPGLASPTKVAATRTRRFFARTLPAEAVLAVAVLAATAVLTSLPPATSEGGSSAVMTRTLGNLGVAFDVEPLQIGSNHFNVTLKSDGKPADDAQKVELQFQALDMEMGQSTVELQHDSGGQYSAQSDALAMSGRWRVDLLVRLPGQLDQRTSFDLNVKA